MTQRTSYGQYCPIAVTAEIVAERWTPLVLRGLFMGATRFTEIQDSVPRMSPALLTRRLRELEAAGIVARDGPAYRLTASGSELFPVLEEMGRWSQHWLRREITKAENLDPDVLMWEIRQEAKMAGRQVAGRRTACFRLADMPSERRFYWLVFERTEIDICTRDPGHDVDLWIEATMRCLIGIWLGHRSVDAALADGTLHLDGNRAERAAFREWFCLSRMARLAG